MRNKCEPPKMKVDEIENSCRGHVNYGMKGGEGNHPNRRYTDCCRYSKILLKYWYVWDLWRIGRQHNVLPRMDDYVLARNMEQDQALL